MTWVSISVAAAVILGSLLPAGEPLPAGPYSQATREQQSADAQPGERVRAAVGALMLHYDEATGLWDNKGWWNGANALTTLAMAMKVSHSGVDPQVFRNTFAKAQLRFPGFLNEFYDDEGWWALGWIEAYDATADPAYLIAAKNIFTDMTGGWDDTCGGGIWWKKDHHYKNAIANELFLAVAARLALHAKGTERAKYGSWALREWKWFQASGMINQDNLINDGLTSACRNNERNTWSYNQGVILGGLASLSKLTGDKSMLKTASSIADAAMIHLVDKDGVLHDKTEPHCSPDTVQFKGIFARNLLPLESSSPNRRITQFLQTNSDAIWKLARTPANNFACTWSGPPNDDGPGASSSALDAFVANALLSAHPTVPR